MEASSFKDEKARPIFVVTVSAAHILNTASIFAALLACLDHQKASYTWYRRVWHLLGPKDCLSDAETACRPHSEYIQKSQLREFARCWASHNDNRAISRME